MDRSSTVGRMLLLIGLIGAGSLGCGGDGSDVISVNACEQVSLPGGHDWQLTSGWPLLAVQAGRFRAPGVARTTTLTFAAGERVQQVQVQPLAHGPELADGMAQGCAPFSHGVASGDPADDGVILWTRLNTTAAAEVGWAIYADAAMTEPVDSGTAIVTPEGDFTAWVEVGGLSPSTTYFYRFTAPDGTPSPLGRTRTAGDEGAHLRVAVASCSSIFSGYFNAYRRIAERDDLDLVIHLGDYLYDFVDENEQVRVPDPEPEDPSDVAGWRRRHGYYLSDPDLRMARAMHPWFVMWDNHDLQRNEPPAFGGGVQAFREWVPMRQPDPIRPQIGYRTLRYGGLLQLILMDVLLHRDQEMVPGTSELGILGEAQYSWLQDTLTGSTQTWRILGSQKIIGTLLVPPGVTEGGYFDTGTWDGYHASRTRLLGLLSTLGLKDNVVLSGDSHISVMMDLVDDPTNPDAPYDPATSDTSVGVEVLPTSISRGNFDEQLGPVYALIDGITTDIHDRNPHQAYLDLVEHGYGLLDIQPERVIAEVWYSPVLEVSDEERLGMSLRVERGSGKWDRTPIGEPTPGK